MLEEVIDVFGYLAEDDGLDSDLAIKANELFDRWHNVEDGVQIKNLLPETDDFANDLFEAGETDYAEQVWDSIADLRQDYEESKKLNSNRLKESEDYDTVETIDRELRELFDKYNVQVRPGQDTELTIDLDDGTTELYHLKSNGGLEYITSLRA